MRPRRIHVQGKDAAARTPGRIVELMFYRGEVSTIPELAAKDWRFRPPRHCFVRFGNTQCPAILLEWRPKRDRGGVSKWEGLVIYTGHTSATGQWDVRQSWIHGDLIEPAD